MSEILNPTQSDLKTEGQKFMIILTTIVKLLLSVCTCMQQKCTSSCQVVGFWSISWQTSRRIGHPSDHAIHHGVDKVPRTLKRCKRDYFIRCFNRCLVHSISIKFDEARCRFSIVFLRAPVDALRRHPLQSVMLSIRISPVCSGLPLICHHLLKTRKDDGTAAI